MRVGITGHQRLADESAWQWARMVMREIVTRQPQRVEAVSSLARGSDQVFADVVLECGGTLYAVIPFPGYERTLDGPALDDFKRLLSRARTEILPAALDDESAYLAAGRRVVELSELMIAVWDGSPARGKGGTGDIVSFARARGTPLCWIDPVSRAVRETR